jgi:signal transduction histidine kinase
MGINDNLNKYSLLYTEKVDFIFDVAYNLSGIYRNSKNSLVAIDRISRIVFTLKSYTHESTSKFTKSDIRVGLDMALTLSLYHNKSINNIEVIKNYTELPEILCNSDELNRVWTNLINNSIQAMNYKGKLEVNLYPEKNNVVVQIIDNGIGISNDIKDKIFLPFFTTKPYGEGTGLGLEITRKIINRHNGTINFESIPGKTICNVMLPIS